MPKNKVHRVIEDSYEFDYIDEKQLTRIGLALASLGNSNALVISKDDLVDLGSLVEVEIDRDLSKLADKMICIQFTDKYTIVLAISVSVEDKTVIAVPFSDNNEDDKFEPYDLYIRLENFDKKDFTMEVHAINPWAEGEDINPAAWDHAVSLSALMTLTLTALQSDKVELVEVVENLDKINKKRIKNKKASLIKPDFTLKIKE